MPQYALGLDYGTNSARALLVDVADGAEVCSAVRPYRCGTDGVFYDEQDPNLARQYPGDYGETFTECVHGVLSESGVSHNDIVGIGVDTTGSTPLPLDGAGNALALDPTWQKNVDSYAWLWKDHT